MTGFGPLTQNDCVPSCAAWPVGVVGVILRGYFTLTALDAFEARLTPRAVLATTVNV